MLILFLVLFAAFGVDDRAGGPPASEVALVQSRLGDLQILSFADEREYCGYLLRLPDGTLGFGEFVRGDVDGCTPRFAPGEGQAIASVHTHGAYDRAVPAEFPTVLDMDSDRREGVDGYVATPGGRLWYLDRRRAEARQLCSLGCLPADPRFHAGDDGEIMDRYSYRDLQRLEAADLTDAQGPLPK